MARPSRQAEDNTETPEASFRFKWLERDIKEVKEGYEALVKRVDGLSDKIDKINRNQLIIACIIIGLGVGSRLFSTDTIELFKKIAGF